MEWRRLTILVTAAVAFAMAGCGEDGDLTLRNDGPDDVSVVWEEGSFSVQAGGGVQILDSGCTDEDVVVTFPSGKVVTVTGPVCPDRVIVIEDDDLELRAP
ncbi:hypothetical protein GTR02_08695 [Kineococcus sp. R8]|uniref:hypothetical protein n=1 Tax=Kineococcus siccus TaxID=2696567 RepID=UPI001412B68D|nr:hypothetical protein [Kineococcus siccus]NAZ81896.1 hypothetical protein [Kineococcus siccus]